MNDQPKDVAGEAAILAELTDIIIEQIRKLAELQAIISLSSLAAGGVVIGFASWGPTQKQAMPYTCVRSGRYSRS